MGFALFIAPPLGRVQVPLCFVLFFLAGGGGGGDQGLQMTMLALGSALHFPLFPLKASSFARFAKGTFFWAMRVAHVSFLRGHSRGATGAGP